MSTTTLILGGGVGGIVTAVALRSQLPSPHRIVLVTRHSEYFLGTSKTWVMLGERTRAQVSRPLRGLASRGIEIVQSEISGLDVPTRTVTTSQGTIAGDHLVIALGADVDPSSIEGLGEAGHTFYTMDGAVRLHDTLTKFEGGRLALVVAGAPFKCPPAPYEAAFLLHEWLNEVSLRDKTQFDLYTVEGRPMATAGPEMGTLVMAELENRKIGYHRQKRPVRADAAKHLVEFQDGSSASYDLLITVPPHQAPRVIKESGLTNASGWIPVDPQTMHVSTLDPSANVYAIGDVTATTLPGRFQADAPLALPKAGIFAEKQAIVVAAEIAARALGRSADERFDGIGFCYIELTSELAMRGDGWFFALPHPTMKPTPPSADLAREKRAWVDRWMDTYLPQ
jgi:sulfide:quinone oxidoreductase